MLSGFITRGWLWAALGGGGGVLAVLILGAMGWPGFRSDGCRAAPYPGCFCEAAGVGLIAQPINTWSSLAFVVVGVLIAVSEDRRRRSKVKRDPQGDSGFALPIYAFVVSLLGPGSMFKHASLTHEGGGLDISSMYLFGAFIWAHALARTANWGQRGVIGLFLSISTLVFVIQRVIDPPMSPMFGLLITGFILTEVWAWTQRQRLWTMDAQYFLWALLTFAVAIAIWVPSMTGGPWCSPDSIFQGHALWHVLCAAAAGLLYRYFVSTRPRDASGRLSVRFDRGGEGTGDQPSELRLALRAVLITGRTLVVLTTLIICELGLRGVGVGPWKAFQTFEELPAMSSPHVQLGWVNRPGQYRYKIGGRVVDMQIAADGRRGRPGPSEVGLFGGSFVFGFGLSDHEVMSAQLEDQRPDLQVANHGVPGYGTLQALLRYRDMDAPPPVVVYGLVELHEGRNVGAWSWLHALDRARRGHHWVATPAVRWEGEALRNLGPVEYRHWAWSETSALVDLFERARIEVHDRTLGDLPEATVQLILRFRGQVDRDGGRFVVALLDAPRRATFYLERLEEEGVEVLDLRHPRYPREWVVPGDGHPDARVHRDWGQQLAGAL